jgi:CRISPR-associated protein Cas2
LDVLVTYDISTVDPAGERRLGRIAAVCERYGQRVQYSVFECRVDDVLLERFIGALTAELDPNMDSINIYRFQAPVDSIRRSLGRPGHDWNRPWIL